LLDVRSSLVGTTSIDDVDVSKPAPDIFTAAAAKVGATPAQTVVVGDTIYDVESATRAGMISIGVGTGAFSARELRTAGAIRTFADVSELLDRLIGASLEALLRP
jgi:phosphoglycolate phosphatase-like HAD superfamily hydrolase